MAIVKSSKAVATTTSKENTKLWSKKLYQRDQNGTRHLVGFFNCYQNDKNYSIFFNPTDDGTDWLETLEEVNTEKKSIQW